MVTVECPFCAGEATTNDDLATVNCAGCGTVADVAPDAPSILEIAA
jgi:endogenous inhibitor of DNA gyrase (YacG/DUF329 family)